MSLKKIHSCSVSTHCLKLFVRNKSGSEKSASPCNKKSIVCDKSKTCSAPNIDSQDVVQEKKDICVYDTCPAVPCAVEPCEPEPPSLEAAKPEEGFPSRKKTKIIVIGAGVAGLSCAHRLIQSGYKNTLILEAEDRPGGRINSGWLKDVVIEKGSDWSCGPSNPFSNHIIQLGMKKGLLKVPLSGVDPSQGLLLQNDCTPLPLPISFMAWSHLREILQKAECIRRQTPQTLSDLEECYIGIRIRQLLKKLPSDMGMICARLLLGLTSYLTPSLRKVVTDSFGAYATAASMRIPLGYMGALAPLITDITPERILYKKQVLTIRWGSVTADQHPRAVIKCRDGSTYESDYVVLAFPLGVLKKCVDTMFCPPLSPAKTKAIQKMKVGHIGKIFLEYDQPFWVWREKRFHQKWSAGALSSRTNFTKGLTCLEELHGSEHVLVACIKGNAVEEMEKLTDSEVASHMTSFLLEWTGECNIPKPKSIIKSGWATNPNFQCAYSYKGECDGESDLCPIRDPLPKGCSEVPPILYFAGEHTCPSDSMGTVRGAMISGVREAELVMTAINQAEFEPSICVRQLACQ